MAYRPKPNFFKITKIYQSFKFKICLMISVLEKYYDYLSDETLTESCTNASLNVINAIPIML